jgi:hypothetical protein
MFLALAAAGSNSMAANSISAVSFVPVRVFNFALPVKEERPAVGISRSSKSYFSHRTLLPVPEISFRLL